MQSSYHCKDTILRILDAEKNGWLFIIGQRFPLVCYFKVQLRNVQEKKQNKTQQRVDYHNLIRTTFTKTYYLHRAIALQNVGVLW